MGDSEGNASSRSPAWAAYYALYGDEDPRRVREYVAEAFDLISRDAAQGDSGDLAELKVFLLTLGEALDPNGETYMQVRLEPRKMSEQGGRRRLSLEDIRRRRQAGARAYGYVTKEKMRKDEAIARAWEDMKQLGNATGLSARIIEREYQNHRRTLIAFEQAKNPR